MGGGGGWEGLGYVIMDEIKSLQLQLEDIIMERIEDFRHSVYLSFVGRFVGMYVGPFPCLVTSHSFGLI